MTVSVMNISKVKCSLFSIHLLIKDKYMLCTKHWAKYYKGIRSDIRPYPCIQGCSV